MSHNLEQQADGTYSFVAAREPGWHKLGKTYPDLTGLTVEKVLGDLNVGEIISSAIYGQVGGSKVVMPGKKMVLRCREFMTDGHQDIPLGVVGDDYQIVGERDAFRFLDNLVDSGEALIQTAGLLDGGKRAFCCMRLPEGILVGGVDPVDLYLLVATSHDGSLALTGLATPIRVQCQNTLTWALDTAKQQWRVRHTKNMAAKMQVAEARRNLELTFAYQNAWAQAAEGLVERKIEDYDFDQIISELWEPDPDASKMSHTMWRQRRDRVCTLYHDAPTNKAITGTEWGALNAIFEEIDWFTGTRKVPKAEQDAYRFGRAVTAGATAEKNRVYAYFAGS